MEGRGVERGVGGLGLRQPPGGTLQRDQASEWEQVPLVSGLPPGSQAPLPSQPSLFWAVAPSALSLGSRSTLLDRLHGC